MRLSDLRNKTAGALFAFALLFGIGIASNVTANAQYRNDQYKQNQQDQRNQQDRDYRDQRRRDRNNDRNGRGRNNDGYGNYGGSFDLRQTALNAGANEGNKAGREDSQHNRPFEYRNKSAFQKGTKDYSSKLGDREIYKQYFREAFSHGYSEGYQGR
jgi:hypothetical protein